MTSQPTAQSISQHLLDQTGRGLMTGDFDIFGACFQYPHKIETFDGERVVEDIDAMRAVFFDVRCYYEKSGVTDLVRHCVKAEFRDDKTVSAIHQSRLVAGSTLVQKPYNAFSIIRCIKGKWLVTQSQYAVDDAPHLCRALVGA